MTTQELINRRKNEIRKILRGFDNTFKLKGSGSFEGLINWAENQASSYNEDDDAFAESAYQKILYVINLASLRANRMRNNRALSWVKDQSTMNCILSMIRESRLLNVSIYSIDEKTVEEFSKTHKDDGMYKNIVIESDKEQCKEFILRYKDTLYLILIPSIEAVNKKAGYVQIRALGYENKNASMIGDYAYDCNLIQLDNKMSPIAETESMSVTCKNKQCPSYKASLVRAFEEGSKELNCRPELCDKCEAFKGEIVSPYKMLEVIKPVIYAYQNRTQSTRIINEGAPVHYEPLPLPESDKDIVIYADVECKHEEVIRIVNHDENYIPGTHASPREHERKAHYRYNRKTGLKDIRVRGCTVNKGHTKTSYTVKNHKDINKELVVS